MLAASSPVQSSLMAGKDSVGEVPATPPLLPNIERLKYQNPRQRPRPPFLKKPPEKNKHKPDDEHKVDDYA